MITVPSVIPEVNQITGRMTVPTEKDPRLVPILWYNPTTINCNPLPIATALQLFQF